MINLLLLKDITLMTLFFYMAFVFVILKLNIFKWEPRQRLFLLLLTAVNIVLTVYWWVK